MIKNEVVVRWVSKQGMQAGIKTVMTRRGGLIHALWVAEHERMSNRRLEQYIPVPQPSISDQRL